MSFPDVRAELDRKASELWHRQVGATHVNEPVGQDSSSLMSDALELVRNLPKLEFFVAKHFTEHSYKVARNVTKGNGKRILERLFVGEWPLEFDLNDATYTRVNNHYPIRFLSFSTYSEILDERYRQAKHEYDRMSDAHQNQQQLFEDWGSLLLSEALERKR